MTSLKYYVMFPLYVYALYITAMEKIFANSSVHTINIHPEHNYKRFGDLTSSLDIFIIRCLNNH